MANVNQTLRAGNIFGTPFGAGYGNNGIEQALKPGYIIKARNNFYVVEAREALSVDLFFTESHTITETSGVVTNAALAVYGGKSIAALLSPNEEIADGSAYTASLLSPSFDSGYIKFDDLEPSFGHLYHLCPTIPSQPKYIDVDTGEFLVNNNYTTAAYLLPSNGGVPMGFDLDLSTTASATPIGLVSPKLYIKHPVGSPINVLDQAPEGDSGSAAVGSLLGVSGFLDGTMSPIENPNWNYSLFIEHGENNLPAFRMVVDCEEYIMDGRVRLTGWKYSIAELSMSQIEVLQSKGRVTYAIINPQGIPTSSSLSGPFMK
jgi:hypothetical protein